MYLEINEHIWPSSSHGRSEWARLVAKASWALGDGECRPGQGRRGCNIASPGQAGHGDGDERGEQKRPPHGTDSRRGLRFSGY